MEPVTYHSNASLDAVDIQILRLLQDNAKLTVREIAAEVHLSTTPVHERIKHLEQSGIIRQYVALLDYRLVHKEILAICYVTLKEHNRKAGKQFVDAITTFPEILECYNISGDFDFMLKIATASMASYHDFYVNKLSEIAGIGQTKSFFVMDVIKDTHKII